MRMRKSKILNLVTALAVLWLFGDLAYQQLVERVLANPAYGERWARHWLDVVRFGETHGFETNRERPNAWRYRKEYVKGCSCKMAEYDPNEIEAANEKAENKQNPSRDQVAQDPATTPKQQ